jgi:hypothetical protein
MYFDVRFGTGLNSALGQNTIIITEMKFGSHNKRKFVHQLNYYQSMITKQHKISSTKTESEFNGECLLLAVHWLSCVRILMCPISGYFYMKIIIHSCRRLIYYTYSYKCKVVVYLQCLVQERSNFICLQFIFTYWLIGYLECTQLKYWLSKWGFSWFSFYTGEIRVNNIN